MGPITFLFRQGYINSENTKGYANRKKYDLYKETSVFIFVWLWGVNLLQPDATLGDMCF